MGCKDKQDTLLYGMDRLSRAKEYNLHGHKADTLELLEYFKDYQGSQTGLEDETQKAIESIKEHGPNPTSEVMIDRLQRQFLERVLEQYLKCACP